MVQYHIVYFCIIAYMPQSPHITPDETKEQFDEKMRAIALKEKEKQVEQEATQKNVPYINLAAFPIGPEAIALIPEAQARAHKALCFLYTGREFRIGAIDPKDPGVGEILFQIEERTKAKGAIYMISDASFEHAAPLYSRVPKFRPPAKGVTVSQDDLQKFDQEFRTFAELEKLLKGVSVSDLVNLLTSSALRAGASDIHLEAQESDVTVRFRLDGNLQIVARLQKSDWPKMISRIKLLAGLKINITDRPQDGHFSIFLKEGDVEVRISTIPTNFGESVVMRILRPLATLSLEDLGLRGAALQELTRQTQRPNGMVITTGPTGSGKTTTLYAVLQKLNTPDKKIVTLEDPIEYKLPGIAQSQIDPSKDYTFAAGLRSTLRQDPDIIMVGEIRDGETADIAIQAALTGHLVLSTIHTNSAAGAIPRFLALGAKPFLLAPAVNGIMAQRLVRKIHDACKEEVQLDEATTKRVREILSSLPKPDTRPALSADRPLTPDTFKFFRGRGCATCFDLGYKGRIGIFEVVGMNKEIEEVILSGKVSEYTLQEIAIKQGMITMVQDGLLKALDGLTTVEEVFSVAE